MKLLVLAVAVPISAQSVPTSDQHETQDRPGQSPTIQKRAIPLDVELILDRARSLPAVYSADIILRIVESPVISEVEARTTLIEEAFRLASRSPYPVKRVVLPASNVDTTEGYLDHAHNLNLDVLSLQCRAVKGMLVVNKGKARDLISNIVLPKFRELNCEHALIEDVSVFYQTLRDVAQQTFTPKEIKDGGQDSFLEKHIRGITSPLEVAPVARMIREVNPPAWSLDVLVHTFSKGVAAISADDRSFSYAMGKSPGREIAELVLFCKQNEVVPDQLLKEYRDYLIRHLSARRCADNLTSPPRPQYRDPDYVVAFNLRLRLESIRDLQAISSDSIQPASVSGKAKYTFYWQTAQGKALLRQAKQLRFSSANKPEGQAKATAAEPRSVAERESSSWQEMLSGFLDSLDKWKPEHEDSGADYFHQKAVLYNAVIDLAPPGPLRGKVLGDYLSFLRLNQKEVESEIDWFFHVQMLISSQGADTQLQELLKVSGIPTIEVYVDVNRRFPQPKRQPR